MRVDNRKKKKSIKNCILNHVNNNLREYIILIILFLIGVVAGVIFINNVNESQKQELQTYITGFVQSLKGDYQIDKTKLLKTSIIENVKLAIILWNIFSIWDNYI